MLREMEVDNNNIVQLFSIFVKLIISLKVGCVKEFALWLLYQE